VAFENRICPFNLKANARTRGIKHKTITCSLHCLLFRYLSSRLEHDETIRSSNLPKQITSCIVAVPNYREDHIKHQILVISTLSTKNIETQKFIIL